LRAIFNLAIKYGLVTVNPVKGVRFLREENEQTRVLSFEEAVRYMPKAVTRLLEVATLMLNTGMRSEEVYPLRREDVHFREGYLRTENKTDSPARQKASVLGMTSHRSYSTAC